MLSTLLESNAARKRRTVGLAISVGLHTSAIALAIAATARASAPTCCTDIFPAKMGPFVLLPKREARPQRDRDGRQGAGSIVVPNGKVNVSFPPVTVDLPPIDATADLVDKGARFGEATLGTGVLGEASGLTKPGSGPYTPDHVDKTVAALAGNPAPLYPSALRAAQIEGIVVARFVVDTLGRAEQSSIVFPEATHTLFADAVRQALLRSRYLPATIAGHPVRQLVEQRFTFSVER